jgi:hypothetical protein
MKLLKTIFWNPVMLIFLLVAFFMFLIAYLHTTPKRYVGLVIEVSSWDGKAKLKTRTQSNNPHRTEV